MKNTSCVDCNAGIIIPLKASSKNALCTNCRSLRKQIIQKRTFLKRKAEGKIQKQLIDSMCTLCNTVYKRDKYSKGKPFCSNKCKGEFLYKKEQEKRREMFYKGTLKYRNRIRIILLEIFGHVCQICRNSAWNNSPIPLQVDHIDGCSKNNLPSNLRLICHNCDALLPTFAGKNRGKGRKSIGLRAYE